MHEPNTGTNRMPRLLSRALLVLGGAVAGTAAAWLLSTASAAANTLPVANSVCAVGQDSIGQRAAGMTFPVADNSLCPFTSMSTGPASLPAPAHLAVLLPRDKPRVGLDSIASPVRSVIARLDGHASLIGVLPIALNRTSAATHQPAVSSFPNGSIRHSWVAEHPLTWSTVGATSAVAGTAFGRFADRLQAGEQHQTTSGLPAAPGLPTAPPFVPVTGPAGIAGGASGPQGPSGPFGNAVGCRFEPPAIGSVPTVGGFPRTCSVVPMSAGRQPGVTPD